MMEDFMGSSLLLDKCDVRHTYQSFFNGGEFPFYDERDPWYELGSMVVRGVQVRLNESDGKGYWEIAQLSEQSLLRINNVSYYTDYLIPNSVLEVDLVAIRFVVLGEIVSLVESEQQQVYSQQSASITFNSPGDQLSYRLASGQKLISVSLFFFRQELLKLLGPSIDGLSVALRQALQDKPVDKRIFETKMNPAMINAVMDLVAMEYTGKMRCLYTQAKVYELICLLLHSLRADGCIGVNLPLDDVERFQEAQRLLLENLSKPISINFLAKQVGVNRSKLEVGFKTLFGSTVYDFYHSHRMQKAKRLLEDSRYSVSQVAEAIGYEHAGNFTAAFKKFYGVLPKYIKRHGLIQN